MGKKNITICYTKLSEHLNNMNFFILYLSHYISVSWTYDHDLYAIWAGVYKVTLNANDGTETPEEIVVDGFIEGESKSLPANTFTREGYTFYGWGTTATSVEPVVKDGKSYKTTEDVTLYAIWRED